jgi:hypothetical protein
VSSVYGLIRSGALAVVRIGTTAGDRAHGADPPALLDSRKEGGPQPQIAPRASPVVVPRGTAG